MALGMMKEYRDLEFLAESDLSRPNQSSGVFVGALTVSPRLIDRVKEAQLRDPKIGKILEDMVIDGLDDCPTQWRVGTDGSLRMGSRLVVPDDGLLRKEILQESVSPFIQVGLRCIEI